MQESAGMSDTYLSKHRILIVDDENTHMLLLSAALERNGYSALGVSDGAQALAALQDNRFEIILTDLKMPGMDGISLLRRARAADPDLVGIVMTGHGSIDSAVEAMKAGAQDYIQKPFDLNLLLQVVSRAYAMRELLLENKRLLQSVRRQAQDLEATNRELEAFSYSVSHDLKGPLQAISGFSELLYEGYRDALDPVGRQYLEFIRGETRRMSEITEGFINLARVTGAEMRYEPLDLSAIAARVTADLVRRHPEHPCAADIQPGVIAEGDARLIAIVLENLLGNAWKFTGKRPDARVEFGSEQRDGITSYFVRDNGAGFDMQHAEKLFMPFHRQHDMADFEGTGIGLSIVKRIIDRHGGRVWADAKPDAGATFHFTLG
jgi:two-component system sensor histidine kinase/response regulator